jgi:exonuclease SbcD
MRIVHTADWHVGRAWKNLNRLDEMERVLDHLALFLEREKIDLLLHAGDVFETGSPTAEAERLVFRFLKRVGTAGVRTILVAGNHDMPARLEAWGTLAELVGVRTIGKPRRANQGGVVEVESRGGERAVVAALPFAPVRTWVSGLELAESDTTARQTYADMFRHAVRELTAGFRKDTVNLLMAHTHLDGATFGESERRVHLGEDWAATPQSLPAAAHYVALGHIHKPQKIEAAPCPTYYAGSPLQLDFGEVNQVKSFLVVDAQPGKPAKVQTVPYEGGSPLMDLRLTWQEMERDQDRLRKAGWLRVTVPLSAPDPDLSRKVRQLLGNALIVHAELPESEAKEPPRLSAQAQPLELYRTYHLQRHSQPPTAEVEEAFTALYEEAGGDHAPGQD